MVGYYNVEVKAGKFSMVALNMASVDGTTYTLDQVFPVTAQSSASTAMGTADQIQTWDQENQKYRYFFRWNKKVGAGKEKSGHWVENVTIANDGAAEDYPLANVALKAGDAVFYYPVANNQTLTIPGQVPAEAAGTLKKGFNMIGVGFPVQWNPNDAGTAFWSDAKFAKSSAMGSADQIQYWDEVNQKYRFFFLYSKKVGAGKEKSNMWVENVTVANDGAAEDYPVLKEALNTGAGFFYYRLQDGEVEFKPGLSL